MPQSYLADFRANYTGNGAPVHIGHHFSGYQGGAYNEALKTFARMVCGLFEVRRTTYAKLADFMDGLSPETLAAYQARRFFACHRAGFCLQRCGEATALDHDPIQVNRIVVSILL